MSSDIAVRYSADVEEDRIFRLAAPHYDEAQETIATEIQIHFANSEANSLAVLEVGCGTGLTSEIILRADDRVLLTALDNVESIVEQVKYRFKGREKNRATFVHADAFDYLQKQPENSFDVVTSALVLHNCLSEYRRKVYSEIFRVLKSGGLFINVDKYASDNDIEHQAALEWQLKQFDVFDTEGRPDLKKKWTEHYYEDEKPEVILRESEYVKDLQVCGFRNIRRVYRYQMEASYVAEK